MEPRARAGKNVGKMNFGYGELRQLLYGSGDAREPLPESMRLLDEIATDFIQSLSFEAARMAHYAGRQKIKYEDFEFALRRNPLFLGKVREMFEMSKEVKDARKMPGIGEGIIGKADVNELAKLGGLDDGDTKGGTGKDGASKNDKSGDDAVSRADGRSSVTAGGSRKRGPKSGGGTGSDVSGSKKKKIKLMPSGNESPRDGATAGTSAAATAPGGADTANDAIDDIFGGFDGAADAASPAANAGDAEAGDDLADLDDDIDAEMR